MVEIVLNQLRSHRDKKKLLFMAYEKITLIFRHFGYWFKKKLS